MASIINVAQNFLRPSYRDETIRKAIRRLTAEPKDRSKHSWYADEAIDAEAWAAEIEPQIWSETQAFAKEHDRHVAETLAGVDEKLGGGAHVKLIYFFIRYLKCRNVLETGVAAGHSSRAMLKALAANGGGKLVSSDFPYLRLKDPERYIGIVVEKGMRENWTLMTNGDRQNLPIALKKMPAVDLFHYDSDKSYEGRVFAMDLVKPHLTEAAVVMFDDADDNPHFHDVASREPYLVFRFGTKMVGMTCGTKSPLHKWMRPPAAGKLA